MVIQRSSQEDLALFAESCAENEIERLVVISALGDRHYVNLPLFNVP